MDEDIRKMVLELQGSGHRIDIGGIQFAPKRILHSGSCLLDWMLGVGGLPSGRLLEFAGSEGGGKTTISMVCAAAVQAQGYEVVWVDAEHSYDEIMARNVGLKDTIVFQPKFGEEALDIVRKFVGLEQVGLIVIDSIAALVPQDELKVVQVTDAIALQARMISLKLRQIFVEMTPTSPTIITINQLRDRVGGWGASHTTPGGRSHKHWAHIRIQVARGNSIEDTDKNRVGNWVDLSYLKSKMTSPDKKVSVPLVWGYGIDRRLDIIESAALLGVVRKERGRVYFEDGETGKFVKDISDEQLTDLFLKVNLILDTYRTKISGAGEAI